MVIRNGLLALPGNREPTPAEVRIKDGRIVEIGASLAAATEVIDAQGLWVLPGAIDPHVHFFDPGYPHKDDFYHATAGSASGGVTMVVDMPSTSIPTVTNGANLKEKLAIVSEKALIDFGFFGGVPGETFQSAFPRVIREMAPDVLGFKCYATSGMEGYSRLNHFLLSLDFC